MNQLPSKVKKNTMNKYLPLDFFPFFQQRCVIGLLISCEIICLGTGWHHQGENSITILYSAQVKLTVSLIHLLLKSYSMSLPSKIKKIKKCNLLELSLISVKVQIPVAMLLVRRKEVVRGICLLLESTSQHYCRKHGQ